MALLVLPLALLAMTAATTAITVPLDMALDSFDDQYQGCGPAMKAELTALNRSKFHNNPHFAKLWPMARAMWQSRGSPVSPLLSPDQAIAIMACTMLYQGDQFNEETCHGVDIKTFGELPEVDEVLVPPFEKFNVTKVIEDGENVEIHLDSIRIYSKYNCEWLNGPVMAIPGPSLLHGLPDLLFVPQCPHWSLWPLPSMALLALTLALLAMTVAAMATTTKRLDMALDSFDDQYQGCGPAMEEALPTLNRYEFQNNPLFAEVWPKAEAEWQKVGSPVSPLSSSDQAIAIMAYHAPDLYDYFNGNVSIFGHSPQEYRDNFHFKTLHFLLTKAVAMLTATQKQQKCQGVIHVSSYKFYASPGDIIRFGQFVQSWGSIDDSVSAPTVFRVQTCHGANISTFAGVHDNVIVLIPPYEKFNVTNIIEDGEKVEIHLDSMGTYSKYNCEWLTGESISSTPGHFGGLLLTTTAQAEATGSSEP
ncbi:hypothetical protein TURU_073154 [Turdus rufiventris]|nr:hypothetical protein TURU_073154 [Turdus rufiventris]